MSLTEGCHTEARAALDFRCGWIITVTSLGCLKNGYSRSLCCSV